MAVFLPRRWNRQPVGPVEIDPYWLSRGLRGSILPLDSGVLYDVARKQLGTGQAFSTTPGPAMMFQNGRMRPMSTSAATAQFATTWSLGTSRVSILAGIVNNTAAFDHGCIIKVGNASTGFGVGLGRGGVDWDSNSGSDVSVLGLFEAVRWINGAACPVFSTTVPTYYNIGIIVDSAGVPAMLLNGVINATQSGTGMVAPAGNISYAGGYAANRYPQLDNLLYAHIFACELKAGDVAALHQNPWQVYMPVSSRAWSLPEAAAVGARHVAAPIVRLQAVNRAGL